ncbi:hypothetical protein KAW38_00815 [Candidatus Micrarchaeota archaeon]|nr:hypothetical protein [Candidatus Micrarchaeota archaeon]
MKIKLTPELSYIIGLWGPVRTEEGIGVEGDDELLSIFSSEIIKLGLAEPNRIQHREGKIFFYHSAYRKFFQDVLKNKADRFKYKNKYMANYLAGLFDSCGMIDSKGLVFFTVNDLVLESILDGINFKPKKKKQGIMIRDPLKFLSFIKPLLKKDYPLLDKIYGKEQDTKTGIRRSRGKNKRNAPKKKIQD